MLKKLFVTVALIISSFNLLSAYEVKQKVEFELKGGINDFFYGDWATSNPHRFNDPAAAFGVSYWFNNHFAMGAEYNWSKLAIGNDETGATALRTKTELNTISMLFKYRVFATADYNFIFNFGGSYLFYKLDVMSTPDAEFTPGKYTYDEFAMPFGVAFNYMLNEKVGLNLQMQNYTTFKDHLDAYTINNPDALDKYDGYVNVLAGLSFYLDTDTDKDFDGIPNSKDKCPLEAEDKDGFEDEDGCPDLDNDKDGIADLKDKAPLEAEDMDGFEDTDGAPDLDNDNDGIADVVDKAPNDAEDKDGFEDEDGAPDLDNDNDGIADATDKCPIVAEDKDGFEDEDGCADLDNDQDGIADLNDKCPNEPETINEFKDDDGCPDVVLKKNDKITLNNIYFQSGKAGILEESYTELNKVQAIFADNPNLEIQIEGHTDSQGNAAKNKKLSAQRAEAIKAYIVEKFGVDKAKLKTVGYGSEKPVSSNKTPEGRSQNRRIEFKILKNN